MDLTEQLQKHFGLDAFRPAQQEVIEDVLRGKDVLCIMPTGAGKSLCYQLPAAVRGGLSIVVSPLISLMEDQVNQLRDEGIGAALLNSSLTASQQRDAIDQISKGFDGLLYVAPERCFAPSFLDLIAKLKPNLLAIDEAHCISQWGHDFRPEYARLGEVRELLGCPPTIALTATATEDVRQHIISGLGLREPTIVITGFDRPNLAYESKRTAKVREKDDELLGLLQSEPGSCIVYCSTRKVVDALASSLRSQLHNRTVVPYHAGLDARARTANQETWMNTPGAIAVATNAFGMGINKPDVRLVVHYNVPGRLEAYYQEAGRAGRDGLPARCVLLFNFQDVRTQEFFIEKIGEDAGADGESVNVVRIQQLKAHATDKLNLMISYARTHSCRRQMILDYFGDPGEVVGCECDVCRSSSPTATHEQIVIPDEVTTLARQLLSGVARLHGKFGVGAVAEVLTGQQSERTQRWRFDELSVWGLLQIHSTKRVIAMLHRLIEAGLARQRKLEGVEFRAVIELTAAGVAVMKGEAQPPAPLIDLVPTGRREGRARVRENEPDLQVDSDTMECFERLRAVRTELAREKQLPAYCICHDRTLREIAHARPVDLPALQQVKGMGPMKVKLYGEALLAALRS